MVSGAKPININMGTKIGAVTAHCADALPNDKFTNPQTMIKKTKIMGPSKPIICNMAAPFTAITVPKLVHLKNATN